MTTLEMEVAIMSMFNVRQNIIVPNVHWGAHVHECDLLVLSQNNYATEVEIKISIPDLLADKKKAHGHYSNRISRLFFAVPKCIEERALIEIPERAGLISVYDNKVTHLARNCKRNTKAEKWSDKERLKLAHLGAMRIITLKRNMIKILGGN